jgi:hypothetical protein
MNKIVKKVINREPISFDESFSLAQITAKRLRKDEVWARDSIIHVLNNWENMDSQTYDIWTELIESAGFYPYLEKEKKKIELKSIDGNIRKEFFKSENLENIYFHEEQLLLVNILNSSKNLIVSAPTSFGKSLLIEEIVASRYFKNIVVIQPTLALLDETRRKLLKYRDDYKIIVRTSQEPAIDRGNLFLLTAERVMEYKSFPLIDFLILDEFYKLSAKRDDERSDSLNNAFYYLINKHKCRFYLLGPNIDEISDGFASKNDAVFFKTNYSLVFNRRFDIYTDYKDDFGPRGTKKDFKENKLFELLEGLKNEQTIIYCSSPKRARYLASKFLNYIKEKDIKQKNVSVPLIEWIEQNVINTWCLIDFLKKEIGIHDGALQKHISATIIQYFNAQQLKYLFCTSTIIEGVNTSAKNVVFFDSTKGNNTDIDYFDYNNIKGRSGRLMVHYIGNIYNFNPQPEKEIIKIDIPFYEQNPVCDEVLINIEDREIRDTGSSQYNRLKEYTEEERSLFRLNGLKIQGQKSILDYLSLNINEIYSFINWTYFPKYEQLRFCLGLAWDNLIKDGETVKPMTLDKLVKVTSDYAKNQSINYLIKSNYKYFRAQPGYGDMTDNEVLDEAIRDSFQILKHWFQYKVPKWLLVIDNLQRYVCEKNNLRSGSYLHYASIIENDFIRENLAILSEYGIPKSAINKLNHHISPDLKEDLVLEEIKKKNLLEKIDFLEYEKLKIIENL